ncbi:hypothetical protein [Janthinobacterium sp. NKUCC06_STL]|uniref:hypothetical protein n=1 Tax=Janthinobacterium sp. NKUCC06_STL TaxID=2842127 RepID=UPI001C5A9B89|nr:hypothetical protein [Janthinobacterium sp. NKUCC06_STL]MBW3508946.1 hypothetical protein [Janthinobacterium sp. NKUCC06_STL]
MRTLNLIHRFVIPVVRGERSRSSMSNSIGVGLVCLGSQDIDCSNDIAARNSAAMGRAFRRILLFMLDDSFNAAFSLLMRSSASLHCHLYQLKFIVMLCLPVNEFYLVIDKRPLRIRVRFYPVRNEDKYIVTFDEKIVPKIPRFAQTAMGKVALMAYHDLQMAKHRTQSLVGANTTRDRVIDAMQRQLDTEKPDLILNAFYWLDSLTNTRTFRIFLSQIANNNPSVKRAAAAFGFGDGCRSDADLLDIFDRLKTPGFATTNMAFK